MPAPAPTAVAVVGEVGQERERRADRRAGVDDRRERLVVDEGGVEDEVHAGGAASRVDDALRQWAVTGHAELVRGVAHRLHLVEGPHLQLAALRSGSTPWRGS